MFYASVPIGVIDCHTIDIARHMADNHIVIRKRAQKLSVLLNHLITYQQSHAVVDFPEIVNVNKHDADNPVLFLRPADKFPQPHNKIIAVIQPRQRVIISHIPKLIILRLKFCDISDTDNLVNGNILLVIINSNFKFQPCFAIFHTAFHNVPLAAGFFKKQSFPHRQNIFFFQFVKDKRKLPVLLDLERKIFIPVAKRNDIVLFKYDIEKGIVGRVTNQTVHLIPSA